MVLTMVHNPNRDLWPRKRIKVTFLEWPKIFNKYNIFTHDSGHAEKYQHSLFSEIPIGITAVIGTEKTSVSQHINLYFTSLYRFNMHSWIVRISWHKMHSAIEMFIVIELKIKKKHEKSSEKRKCGKMKNCQQKTTRMLFESDSFQFNQLRLLLFI